MHFPPGVTSLPGHQMLIAKDAPAVICINTRGQPANAAYDPINERTFAAAIFPYLHGDWAGGPFQIAMEAGVIAYSGAEHRGSPKQPNITVVPNWPAVGGNGSPAAYTVMGCTMGHFHPHDPCGSRIQELYEFQSPGLLVLDRENGAPELWVANDGEKVAVPSGCHMTLYNLGQSPLITLDFADPSRNPSDKTLVRQYGPILLVYCDHATVTFVLNGRYVNHPNHRAGVRLGFAPLPEERCLTIPRSGRLDLGQFLVDQLTHNPEVSGKFARLGLRIKRASVQTALGPLDGDHGPYLYCSRPLAEAAVPGSPLYRFFLPNAAENGTGAQRTPHTGAFTTALLRKTATVKKQIALQPLNRPLVVLVQGAGDWVEKAYRPTLISLVKDGHQLSVFYADDTSWKGERPAWTHTLRPWEVYLDKADHHDRALYQNVLARVDVVFVATADVLHAEVATECVRRKVPLIFVEKPFDSHSAHVESLVREMGFLPLHRAVLGVDHYMLYAVALRELMPILEPHLGGALGNVTFYMTETRPIERERERSLQYGLMLDMLPHLLALLAYFGAVQTVDDIQVLAAGQYAPLISQDRDGNHYEEIGAWYRNETYARVQFTFVDYAGNRVPCLGVVGKGLAAEVKYLEVTGINGNAVRIDLGNAAPHPTAYPSDSIFLLADPGHPPCEAQKVVDPYDSTRSLYILLRPTARLDRERYKKLLVDLIKGTDNVIANVLLLDEAYAIVQALDRIWGAIQEAKGQWRFHALGKLQPVHPEVEC